MAVVKSAGTRRGKTKSSLSEASSVARQRGKIFMLGLFSLVIVALSSVFFLASQQQYPSNASLSPPEAATFQHENSGVSGVLSSTSVANNKIIDSDNIMPAWMKTYFAWHAAERTRLMDFQDHRDNHNNHNWTSSSFRFLMMQCLPGSRKCGGTADRLKPLPLMLWAAHRSQRLLLIKWGRPAELEEFLLPPQGGMDWRVPDWLWGQTEFRQGPRATNVEELLDMTATQEYTMIKARVQSHDHGLSFYNDQRQGDESSFQDVYHACWRVMFTPTPPIAQLIERQMQEAGLVPGHYVGIHVRALYAVAERDPGMVKAWTRNAVNCASQLQPGGPFFLSSDSSHAVVVGREYGEERKVLVASHSIVGAREPYHLDKAPRSAKNPSDFYDTFVDLYLLAMSRCVTYNMGGYGTWALYISPYANGNDGRLQNNGKSKSRGACAMQHHEASGMHKCDWVNPVDGSSKLLATGQSSITISMFDPPMP